MKSDSAIHDAVWSAVPKLVAIVAPALRPEEQKEAASEMYAVLKQAFTEYEIKAERIAGRLQPGVN